MSSKKLPPGRVCILSKALNFVLAPCRVSKHDIIVEIEDTFWHIKDVTCINLARGRLPVYPVTLNPLLQTSLSVNFGALHDLNSDQTIVILSADNEKSTVVVSRAEFIDGMELLSDPLQFKKLTSNPTPSSER